MIIRGETKELVERTIPEQLCSIKLPNGPFKDLKKPPQ
jgi:hypothetical protein